MVWVGGNGRAQWCFLFSQPLHEQKGLYTTVWKLVVWGEKKGELWIFLAGEVCVVPPREGALPSKIHPFRGDKPEQEWTCSSRGMPKTRAPGPPQTPNYPSQAEGELGRGDPQLGREKKDIFYIFLFDIWTQKKFIVKTVRCIVSENQDKLIIISIKFSGKE